jgi:transcriptional regulator with XRE-family HTH domain
MIGLKQAQLFMSFGDKDYRDAFVDEHLSAGLARQIRDIRESKSWTQQELAEKTGKAQETISQWENLDYGRFTLKSLKTLASAFDVALMVNFVSFKELINRVSNQSPELIAPPSYDEEKQLSFADVYQSAREWMCLLEAKPSISAEFNQLQLLRASRPTGGKAIGRQRCTTAPS